MAAILAVVGCGDDDDDASAGDTSTTSSSSSGTASGTASGTGTSTTVDPTTASTSVDTGMSEPSSSGSDTSGDTGTASCELGGCGPGEYCDFPIDDCGAGDTYPASCTAARSCEPDDVDPVCGCNGIVYANACGASVVGVDVDATGGCAPPTGRFACGFRFCNRTTSYCQISRSDIGGFPDSYSCVPLPEACGDAPDCTCLIDEPCADFGCAPTPTDDGGFAIECPGG